MMEVESTQKQEGKEERVQGRYRTPYGYGVLDNFGAHLIGRVLSFEIINNKTVTGKLKAYGQFDVIVTDTRTGQDLIIMKHAIITIQGDFSVKPGSTIERK